VYIDDLLIHSKTHKEHLEILAMVFSRLRAHNLKINLSKWIVLVEKNISYLGLIEEGIITGKYKLKTVARAKPPESVQEIRQFFCTHLKIFAQAASPLTCLTKKGMPMEGRTPTT
jgi:hypothetical protein